MECCDSGMAGFGVIPAEGDWATSGMARCAKQSQFRGASGSREVRGPGMRNKANSRRWAARSGSADDRLCETKLNLGRMGHLEKSERRERSDSAGEWSVRNKANSVAGLHRTTEASGDARPAVRNKANLSCRISGVEATPHRCRVHRAMETAEVSVTHRTRIRGNPRNQCRTGSSP